MPRRRRALPAFILLAVVAAGCGSGTSAGGKDFDSRTPGVLTVATAVVPAPGFWDGTAAAPTGGFEHALAGALAEQLGLETVKTVIVPFADIAAGRLGGADLALTQMTATDEREASADFSTPYLSAPPGVLVRHGVTAADAAELKELRWAVLDVSTLTPVVDDSIRPDADPIVVTTRQAELDALRAGRADAVLLDLPVARGIARAEPGSFAVAGQLTGSEGLSAVLPEGSDNREIVDSSIRTLAADGTIDDLESEWLGGSGSDVPLIRVERD